MKLPLIWKIHYFQSSIILYGNFLAAAFFTIRLFCNSSSNVSFGINCKVLIFDLDRLSFFV